MLLYYYLALGIIMEDRIKDGDGSRGNRKSRRRSKASVKSGRLPSFFNSSLLAPSSVIWGVLLLKASNASV